MAQLDRRAPSTERRRRCGCVARKLEGRGTATSYGILGGCCSTHSRRTSRSGATVSSKRTQGRALHEHAVSSSSRMWKRCCASTSTGSRGGRRDAAPAPAATSKNSEEGPTGGRKFDSHVFGSDNLMLIGDDLESASIRNAHVLPKLSVMFDQSRGCASATARQCRQTCATPGTQRNVVFLSVCPAGPSAAQPSKGVEACTSW